MRAFIGGLVVVVAAVPATAAAQATNERLAEATRIEGIVFEARDGDGRAGASGVCGSARPTYGPARPLELRELAQWCRCGCRQWCSGRRSRRAMCSSGSERLKGRVHREKRVPSGNLLKKFRDCESCLNSNGTVM